MLVTQLHKYYVSMVVLILANGINKYEIQSVEGKLDKYILGRLTKGVDLLDGLLEVCKRHKVKAATVSCIGSLQQVGYVQPQLNENKQLEFTEPKIIKKPAELLSGNGFIGFGENGDLDIHFHGVYVDVDGQISGGHFLRGENPTAVTVEFAIQSTNYIYLKRERDKILNMPVFNFYKEDEPDGNFGQSS